MRALSTLTIFAACHTSTETADGVVALADDSALVIWHRPHAEFFMSHLDQNGSELWTSKLAGYPQVQRPGAFWASDTLVGVREYVESEPIARIQIETFSVATGKREWTTGLATFSAEAGVWEGPANAGQSSPGFGTDAYRYEPVAVPALASVTTDEGFRTSTVIRDYRLHTLDLRTGVILRSDRVGADMKPIYAGSRWLINDGAQTRVLEGVRHRELDLRSDCAGGLDVVGWSWQDASPAIFDVIGNGRRVVIDRRALPDLFLDGCAVYGDRFVLRSNDRGWRTTILSSVDRNGKVTWQLRIPGHIASYFDRAVPGSTEILTRYVPYDLEDHDTAEHRLVVIDLDHHAIVSVAKIKPSHVFRVGKRWYVASRYDSTVVVVDGDTGRIVTKRLRGARVDAINAANVNASSLWVHSEDDDERPSVACLDAKTLEPRFVTGAIQVQDAELERLQ